MSASPRGRSSEGANDGHLSDWIPLSSESDRWEKDEAQSKDFLALSAQSQKEALVSQFGDTPAFILKERCMSFLRLSLLFQCLARAGSSHPFWGCFLELEAPPPPARSSQSLPTQREIPPRSALVSSGRGQFQFF